MNSDVTKSMPSHSVPCALRSALNLKIALRSALCALRSALCALRSALCALRSALNLKIALRSSGDLPGHRRYAVRSEIARSTGCGQICINGYAVSQRSTHEQ